MAADENATPEDLVRQYSEREALKRAAFTAGLKAVFKARMVNGVVHSKREKAVAEVLRGMDRHLGPPPWDAVTFRERLKRVGLEDIREVGIKPEELEAYARIRSFIKDDPQDRREYLPSPSPPPPPPIDMNQRSKEARATLDRQVGNLLNATPKGDQDTLKEKLSHQDGIIRLCGEAGVTFAELWEDLTAPRTEVG